MTHATNSENWISWDIEHPALDETLIAGCAVYKAFDRFLSGKDLFILPRTRNELASVLYVNQFVTRGGTSTDGMFLRLQTEIFQGFNPQHHLRSAQCASTRWLYPSESAPPLHVTALVI